MNSQRILLDVELTPMIGTRFQPTGFPDLGPGQFERPDGSKMLLVESEQSMANHLEGQLWDPVDQQPVDPISRLPYVRVVRDDGSFVTSSRIEPHRLASAYVKDSSLDKVSMVEAIAERLNLQKDQMLDHRSIARAVWQLDPLCLLHGVFFADKKWPGQPKIARAVTSFVEAEGVQPAESGGVKKDAVRHSLDESSGGTSEGYGTVPFARTAWTAKKIVAYFSIDLKQIQSYGLGQEASDLLRDLALLEVRSLLEDGLRLRTACDLTPVSDTVVDRSGAELPSSDQLVERVTAGIDAVADQFETQGGLDVVWDGGKKKS